VTVEEALAIAAEWSHLSHPSRAQDAARVLAAELQRIRSNRQEALELSRKMRESCDRLQSEIGWLVSWTVGGDE
jgi:hypothetical protein